MENKLKRLLVAGFTLLSFTVLLSNHFLEGTVNILGNNGFKVGNKTFAVKEIEGLEFSTDDHYNEVFSQPYASFFILKSLDDNMVELVLSGTQIRTNAYQGFNDIIADYKSDSTLTVLSTNKSSNYMDVKFINKADSTNVIFARFYQAYPYFLQLVGSWKTDQNKMPNNVERALNAVRVVE